MCLVGAKPLKYVGKNTQRDVFLRPKLPPPKRPFFSKIEPEEKLKTSISFPTDTLEVEYSDYATAESHCDSFPDTLSSSAHPPKRKRPMSPSNTESLLQYCNDACPEEFLDPLDTLSKLQHLAEAYELLRVLCILNSIALHKAIFLHTTAPQERWSSSGEIEEIKIVSNIKALQNPEIFLQTIKTLLSLCLIRSIPGSVQERIFTIDSQVSLHLQQPPARYKSQAMKMVLFGYPRIEEICVLYVIISNLRWQFANTG